MVGRQAVDRVLDGGSEGFEGAMVAAIDGAATQESPEAFDQKRRSIRFRFGEYEGKNNSVIASA